MDLVEHSEDSRLRHLRAALVADMEVAEEHTRWRNPELKSRVDATQSSLVEREGAAISAWHAGERNRVLGRKLSAELPDAFEEPARDAKVMELDALKQFEASEPLNEGVISKAVVSTGR